MIDAIKQLREETGASIGEIRSALAESNGDSAKARELLREKLGAIAEKKSSREVTAGIVDAYVHSNGRMGVLVELLCETDFVARNPEFKKLAHDIVMHITALAPESVPMLLEQPFIKDESKTVGALLTEAIMRFGENIQITRFSRFEI